MTILCVGSINVDHVYRVAQHPAPGETLADKGYTAGLGGKGANMSLAAAAAGAAVRHVGALGAEGGWCRDRLAAAGINVSGIAEVGEATGHAVIMVDDAGENIIVIHPGANRALTEIQIDAAIAQAQPGDWLLLQNETNLVPFAARAARAAGLKVAYAAAPFEPLAAAELVEHADLLAVNEVEAAQLASHLGREMSDLPVAEVLVTRGARGAVLHGATPLEVAAFPVEPVDTTGAGDTFFGYFLAGLDTGAPADAALRRASAASAIQITRPGAADAIPSGAEVDAFLAERT